MAATEASRSGGPADSYIGSLISLTSKSEIRYEGVLYNINTEESSIGLRNVRSFGTEGRKKDGQQVLPSDKVYEYILFRGSDIKDLQVKSSPVVQTPPIHNDPAIIQSHYSRPPSMSTSSPATVSGSVGDLSSAQMGLQRSAFQGGLPLYQPGGGLGSWAPSPPPPSANGGALQVPMYWQGFYGPPGGLPHIHQQSLLRPPPGLSMSHSMQQSMQYGGMSALPIGASNLPTSNFPLSNLSEFPPPLLPPVSSAPLNLTSSTMTSTLPSTLAPVQTAAVASETSPSLMPNMAPTSAHSTAPVTPLTASSLDVNVVAPSTSNKPMTVPGPSIAYQTMSRSVSSTAGTSSSSYTEPSTPSLVTPDQLLQPGTKTLASLRSSKPLNKDAEVVQSSSEEPRHPAQTDVQAPILPLPSPSNQKLNGPLHSRHNHNFRGRQRGRGSGARHVTQFTEDFDFMAMNEKFKKDEVWGHLGKINKSRNGNEDEEDFSDDEDYSGSSKLEKPVYVKDDFFDTLSCTALDHASGNGRTRFSEQRKLDTETFGDFPRHRGGRGGRSWTPYYGRGYGYNGRGRGHGMSNRFN